MFFFVCPDLLAATSLLIGESDEIARANKDLRNAAARRASSRPKGKRAAGRGSDPRLAPVVSRNRHLQRRKQESRSIPLASMVLNAKDGEAAAVPKVFAHALRQPRLDMLDAELLPQDGGQRGRRHQILTREIPPTTLSLDSPSTTAAMCRSFVAVVKSTVPLPVHFGNQ